MTFHEISLPARLAFGSTGGVERRTEIVTLGSGFESRSTPWAHGRRRYLIGANLRSLDDAAALTAFFEARRGRLYGFRFRDFSDCKSCSPGSAPQPRDQVLGEGDGVRRTFALIKHYRDSAGGVDRPVKKPVTGTVRVAIDGVEISPEDFTVDSSAGVVTFAAAPAIGATVSAGFEFDTPVRFDADRIEVTLESFDTGRLTAVPLLEVRI